MDIYAYHLENPRLNYIQLMTTAEISDKLVSRGSIKKPMSMSRLGMVLQQAGFQSKRMNHGKTRGWLVRERGMEEVNANRNINARPWQYDRWQFFLYISHTRVGVYILGIYLSSVILKPASIRSDTIRHPP